MRRWGSRSRRDRPARAAGGPARLGWSAGAVVLVLLAWQGHHLARWLPQFERTIEGLGPWGPVLFCFATLAVEPFLVPDTLFGLAAGAAFGLVAGTIYYFSAVYAVCLGCHWLGSRRLRATVLRQLESRPTLRALVESAPRGGARFVFLVRLVPFNPAVMSYALGAVGVPLRAAAVGNLGMFAHMFPTLYFGAAAVHVTRMAGGGHRHWETQGLLLIAGLAVCVLLALGVTRWAGSAIAAQTGGSR